MSDRLIERHIVEQFATSIRDPGEQGAAMRALIPGVSTLDDLFVAVEAHRVKSQRLMVTTRDIAVLKAGASETESEDDGDARVVAAYAGYQSKSKDFRRSRPASPKYGERYSLARDIAKEVSQNISPRVEEYPNRSRGGRGSYRGARGARRGYTDMRYVECLRCHDLGHFARECQAVAPRMARRPVINDRPNV